MDIGETLDPRETLELWLSGEPIPEGFQEDGDRGDCGVRGGWSSGGQQHAAAAAAGRQLLLLLASQKGFRSELSNVFSGL